MISVTNISSPIQKSENFLHQFLRYYICGILVIFILKDTVLHVRLHLIQWGAFSFILQFPCCTVFDVSIIPQNPTCIWIHRERHLTKIYHPKFSIYISWIISQIIWSYMQVSMPNRHPLTDRNPSHCNNLVRNNHQFNNQLESNVRVGEGRR